MIVNYGACIMPRKGQTGKGLDSFQFLASNAPYKLSVFAMDGDKAKLPFGIQDWETREPGSLKGVLNAYAYCIDKIENKQPFTTHDILAIHEHCVDNVSRTQYDKLQRKAINPVNKGFRKYSEPVTFHFNPGVNLSKAGCKNVARYIWENIDNPDDARYMWMKVSSAEEIENFLIRYLEADAENRSGFPPSLDGLSEIEDNSLLPNRVQRVLDNLYQQLEKISDSPHASDLKITAIVSAVQELEQIHPFADANCRTFCLVLLNSLLMQQGFEPAIIDDPNKFDGFSVKELVETVQYGMQETRKLVDETYEQEYFQRCSESSEEDGDEPSYDGYCYLTDDSETDEAESDGLQDEESNFDTDFADFLTDKLTELSKKHNDIELFQHFKDEVQHLRSEHEDHQSDQQDRPIPDQSDHLEMK